MKKLILILMLLLSPAAMADHGHGSRGGYHGGFRPGPSVWVAPLIVGGVIGYAIASRPPVVYAPPPVFVGPYAPPYGYHWEQILDANCNCYRVVLAQN